MAHVDVDAEHGAAGDDHGAPDRLHPFILSFPSGPHDLLADDEPLDDRAGAHHSQAHAEAGAGSQEDEPDAAERAGGRVERRAWGLELEQAGRGSRPHGPAAQGEAKARRRRKTEAMTDTTGVRVEATGETVGEAKWAALRELEQLVPGVRARKRPLPGGFGGRERPARRRLHACARRRGSRQRPLPPASRARKPPPPSVRSADRGRDRGECLCRELPSRKAR